MEFVIVSSVGIKRVVCTENSSYKKFTDCHCLTHRLNIVQPSMKIGQGQYRLMVVGMVHHGRCLYDVSLA